MKGLRKWIFPLLVLLMAGGLIYTLTLDTSIPALPPEEEQSAASAQTEEAPHGFVEIAYTVGDMRLQFAINQDGDWQWQDDVSFPLDSHNISLMATELESMSYQRAIPFTDTVLASEYGLDDPWCTIEAVNIDGTTLRLDFGNCGTEEGTHYVIKDGDDSRALVYELDWIDMVFTPVYDMMVLPVLPELTATTLQGLVVTVGENLVAWQPAFTEDDTQTWHMTGVDGTVEHGELMGVLSQLQVAKCFNYKPSDGAVTICGLEEPEANVVITYGEEGAEVCYLNLNFGTLSMDEAYRYMSVGEESTIYLIEEELAAPLMALAS